MNADQRALLTEAAEEWDSAERAYGEERAKYFAIACGDPPEGPASR